MSAVTLAVAISSAFLTVVFRFANYFRPDLFHWMMKSSIALILIGVSFACFQFAVSRTRSQIVLGLTVAIAFILWGSEQYLSNKTLVPFVDDLVVFLFVLDLTIVIYGQLKLRNNSARPGSPFDTPEGGR